jgi:hypothetical protein
MLFLPFMPRSVRKAAYQVQLLLTVEGESAERCVCMCVRSKWHHTCTQLLWTRRRPAQGASRSQRVDWLYAVVH